jgi:proteasome lid subunit RPN8/RPN11
MTMTTTTIDEEVNEQCWVLLGHYGRWAWSAKYDRYTVGQPARVAFDPDYVWANRHRLIGWIHTHPSFTADPSNTDDATMRAQVCSLGRPLLCCIEGTDGLRAHWYVDDESNPIEYKVARVRRKLFGLIPNKELAGRNDGNEEVCA